MDTVIVITKLGKYLCWALGLCQRHAQTAGGAKLRHLGEERRTVGAYRNPLGAPSARKPNIWGHDTPDGLRNPLRVMVC